MAHQTDTLTGDVTGDGTDDVVWAGYDCDDADVCTPFDHTEGLFVERDAHDAATPVFTPDAGLGDTPELIALEDFTGDGRADVLLHTDQGYASYQLLTGNSDGTFAAPVSVLSGFQYEIGPSFVDNGKAAVLAAGLDDQQHEVLQAATWNSNTQQFDFSTIADAAATSTFLSANLSSDPLLGVRAADVDGSGRDSLVGSDGAVLLQNSGGTFTAHAGVTSFGSYDVGVGRVTGSGTSQLFQVTGDWLVARPWTGAQGWGQPVPVFHIPGVAGGGIGFVGDLNGDGVSDFAASGLFRRNGGGQDGSYIWTSAPGGGFDRRWYDGMSLPSAGPTPPASSVPDLLVTNGTSVVRNLGDGSFDWPLTPPRGGSVAAVAGRLGGSRDSLVAVDGIDDIVAAYGPGAQGPLTGRIVPHSGQWRFAAVSDINGDGHPDVVGLDQGYDVVASLGDSSGHLVPSDLAVPLRGQTVGTTTVDDTNGPTGPLVVTDVTGDGKPDVLVGGQRSTDPNGYSQFTALLVGDGHGGFSAPSYLSRAMSAVADVTGDGKPDLIGCTRNASYDCQVSVTSGTNTASGTFAATPKLTSTGLPSGQLQSAPSLGVGDLNGDHSADLVISASDGNVGRVWTMLGKGDGTFHPASQPVGAGGGGSLVVTDVDGDGRMDIVDGDATSYQSGAQVRLGNGDGSFARPVTYDVSFPTNLSPVTGDLNAVHVDGSARPQIGVGTDVLANATDPAQAPAVDAAVPAGYAVSHVVATAGSGTNSLGRTRSLLAWTPPADSLGAQVCTSTAQSTPAVPPATDPATQCADEGEPFTAQQGYHLNAISLDPSVKTVTITPYDDDGDLGTATTVNVAAPTSSATSAPQPPSNVSTSPTGASTATLTWDASPTASVTNYVVTLLDTNEIDTDNTATPMEHVVAVLPKAARSFDVSGLDSPAQACNRCVYGVYAADDAGNVSAGQIVAVSPSANGAATAPAAPSNVQGVAGNGKVTLSWTPPSNDGGAPISDYTVTATPAIAPSQVSVDAADATATVTGLTDGTSYVFHVAAVNVVGAGPAADSAPVTPTAPAGTPGAPAVTVTPDDGHVHVAWTAPTDNGGSQITGYDVTASPVGNTPPVDAHVSGSTTSTTLPVTNGITYVVTVAADNANGTGAPSSGITVTPPGVIAGLQATATLSNAAAPVETVHASWDAASLPPTASGVTVCVMPAGAVASASCSGGQRVETSAASRDVTVPVGSGSVQVAVFVTYDGTGDTGPASTAVLPGADLRATAPSAVASGAKATLTATLRDASDQSAISGEQLQLWSRPAGGQWSRTASPQTGSGGTASVTVHPTLTTNYEWRYAGGQRMPAVAQSHVSARYVVHAALVHSSVKHGHVAEVWGTLAPSVASGTVSLSGAGKTLSARVVKQRLPDGSTRVGYIIRFTPKSTGVEHLKVSRAKDADALGGTSTILTLHVT